MLNKSVDPYGALLAYRTASLECGYSPAQLLMGRQLRTSIPVMASTLQPRWDESKQLRDRQENIKTRQTVDYDRYHRAQSFSTLCAGDHVWVQYAKIGGTVVGKAGLPRSYLVQTPTTCLRRKRRHLAPTPNVTLENLNDRIDEKMNDATTLCLDEFSEREGRKLNIMLFNVPESEKEDPEEKKKRMIWSF